MLEFNSKGDKISWEEGWEDIRNINFTNFIENELFYHLRSSGKINIAV